MGQRVRSARLAHGLLVILRSFQPSLFACLACWPQCIRRPRAPYLPTPRLRLILSCVTAYTVPGPPWERVPLSTTVTPLQDLVPKVFITVSVPSGAYFPPSGNARPRGPLRLLASPLPRLAWLIVCPRQGGTHPQLLYRVRVRRRGLNAERNICRKSDVVLHVGDPVQTSAGAPPSSPQPFEGLPAGRTLRAVGLGDRGVTGRGVGMICRAGVP
jgi:hypothetical protein